MTKVQVLLPDFPVSFGKKKDESQEKYYSRIAPSSDFELIQYERIETGR